ncbi:MAG: hypothetical protein GC164_14815 [Phycisphaera sp.]|nr:hypothetical protein [Phycisphaera sp.]
MRREQPRVLKGDWRTARSQAMREHPGQKAVYRNHINRSSGHKAEGWPSLGFAIGDEHLPDNPNRGAARSKILPLGEDWTQTVRIERWRLHALLLDAFLICPVCKAKYKKLFLPMCTQDEWRDAEFARLWLESHAKRITTAPPDSVTRQTAHRLVERYGLLFPPRRFVCKQCLGVRYGEGLRKRDRVPRRQIRARPLAAGRRTRALVIGVGRIGRVHPTSHTARGRPGP